MTEADISILMSFFKREVDGLKESLEAHRKESADRHTELETRLQRVEMSEHEDEVIKESRKKLFHRLSAVIVLANALGALTVELIGKF